MENGTALTVSKRVTTVASNISVGAVPLEGVHP